MKITEVRVYKVKNGDNLKASASITLDKGIVITGLKVVKGSKGLFVSMPSAKGKDNEWYDIAFPITKEWRETITEKVLEKYNEE